MSSTVFGTSPSMSGGPSLLRTSSSGADELLVPPLVSFTPTPSFLIPPSRSPSRADRGSSESTFFMVGKPQHYRVIVLMAAGVLALTPLVSTLSWMTLVYGCVMCCVAHSTGYHWLTIAFLWGTCFLFVVFSVWSDTAGYAIDSWSAYEWSLLHSFRTLLALIFSLPLLFFTACVGAFISIHVRWFQKEYPELTCLMESFVISFTPIASLPFLTSLLIGFVGSSHAPLAFLVMTIAIQHYFYCPMHSSFLYEYRKAAVAAASTSSHPGMESAMKSGVPVIPYACSSSSSSSSSSSRSSSSSLSSRGAAADRDTEIEAVPCSVRTAGECIFFTTTCVYIAPAVIYNVLQADWGERAIFHLCYSAALTLYASAFLLSTPATSFWYLMRNKTGDGADGGGNLSSRSSSSSDSPVQHVETLLHIIHSLVTLHRDTMMCGVVMCLLPWVAYQLTQSSFGYLFIGVSYPWNGVLLVLVFFLVAAVLYEIHGLLKEGEQKHWKEKEAKEQREAAASASPTAQSSVAQSAPMNAAARRRLLFQTRAAAYREVIAAEARRRPVMIMLGGATLIMCVLLSVPWNAMPFALFAVLSLHLFLLECDSRMLFFFIMSSSWLLMWWMYRMYSFVVSELKVYGEPMTIYSPLVAVNVLFCYILGCMCFGFAFNNTSGLLVCLWLYSTRLGWVEHVLYSQQEDDVYPGGLVLLSGALGAVTAMQMYSNSLLSSMGAFVIASTHVAKIVLFAVEVCSMNYLDDLDVMPHVGWLQVLELQAGWYAAVGVSVVLMTMEQRKRNASRSSIVDAHQSTTYWCFIGHSLACFILALATARNVQRMVYEFVTQSYVSFEELVHISPGTVFVTYCLLTLPFYRRHMHRYLFIRSSAVFLRLSSTIGVCGLLLVVIQPTRFFDDSGTDGMPGFYAYGRMNFLAGSLMVCASRLLPLHRAPFSMRLGFWCVACLFLGAGVVATVLPYPTLIIWLWLSLCFFFTTIVIDMAHYRLYDIETNDSGPSSGPVLSPSSMGPSSMPVKPSNSSGLQITSEGKRVLQVYGISVACLVLAACFTPRRGQLEAEALRAMPDAVVHRQAIVRLLAIGVALSFFITVVVKLRIHNHALFVETVPLYSFAPMHATIVRENDGGPMSAAALLLRERAPSPAVYGDVSSPLFSTSWPTTLARTRPNASPNPPNVIPLLPPPVSPTSLRRDERHRRHSRSSSGISPTVYMLKCLCNTACLTCMMFTAALHYTAGSREPFRGLLAAPFFLLMESSSSGVWRSLSMGRRRYTLPVLWCLLHLWFHALLQKDDPWISLPHWWLRVVLKFALTMPAQLTILVIVLDGEEYASGSSSGGGNNSSSKVAMAASSPRGRRGVAKSQSNTAAAAAAARSTSSMVQLLVHYVVQFRFLSFSLGALPLILSEDKSLFWMSFNCTALGFLCCTQSRQLKQKHRQRAAQRRRVGSDRLD